MQKRKLNIKKLMNTIIINKKKIGFDYKPYIIAEAGVNHNGQLDLALKLVEKAAWAGADAIKFQTFDPNTLVTKNSTKAKYQYEDRGNETQYEMLKRLMLRRENHHILKQRAESLGLTFLSTPFSSEDVEFLSQLGIQAFKVGSGDMNNIPLLKIIAKKNLPIILSTGMSTLAEVKESVSAIQNAGNNDIILLHCTTNYPTPFNEVNLRVMATLRREFGLLVGYSDHTLGIEVPIAAASLGAVVIEKHFTVDRTLPGPDHKASLEPNELKKMILSVRNIKIALGSSEKKPNISEIEIAKIARKSIIAKHYIQKGKSVEMDDLDIKRPGTGIEPKHIDDLVGKKAKFDIAADEVCQWDMFN